MEKRIDDFIAEHRAKNFRVEVTPRAQGREWDDDFRVSITHNGYQWQAIGLTKDEIPKVIDAMQGAIGENTLLAQNRELVEALERTSYALELAFSKKPLRDMAETLAEAKNVLAKVKS